jgi:hypothetical protein
MQYREEQHYAQQDQTHPTKQIPQDWARLIRKLRWIGLEEEAERLEFAVSTMPLEKRGSVSCGPFNTD